MFGIRTRKPIYFATGFLIVLGLVPKIGAFATSIPELVLGGAMMILFGIVVTQGVKMLSQVDLNEDGNLMIVALSFGLGLGVTVVPELFANLPAAVQTFTGNGIVVTSVTAITLTILSHHGRKKQLVETVVEKENLMDLPETT
ncbi:Permease family protein [Carnobacterium iners]|nr:Permease family protein [Carnobacterium iners]